MDNLETSQTPSPSSRRWWVWFAAVFVLVIAVGGGVFWYINSQGVPSPTPTQNPTAYIPISTELPRYYGGQSENPAPVMHAGEVAFSVPQSYEDLNLIPSEASDLSALPSQSYQKIGTFVAGQYTGADLVLATVAYEGPGGSTYYRFAVHDGVATMLQQHSDAFSSDPRATTPLKFTIDKTYGIAELLFPNAFRNPQGTLTFVRDAYVRDTWDAYTRGHILMRAFSLAGYGDVFTDDTTVIPKPSQSSYGSSFRPGSNGFYLQAPDGTVRVYAMQIPFVKVEDMQNGVPNVTWSDGTANVDSYTWADRGGCGSVNYASVITSSDVSEADLTTGGTTSTGDPLLVFKDSTNQFLKNIYENEYPGDYVNGSFKKVPYATFAASHPVFFWRDPLGRLIKFLNFKFMVQAECGKPVIYLYPEKTESVSVKVLPRGGMTASEPAYGDGWVVTAQPDGRLTDASGMVWPYLFWEGSGGIYARPDRGWVVPRDAVKTLLDEKLAAFGFISKEISDFDEFWLPRMQDAPYYFITFLGTSQMNDIAPFEISPKPDTIIRVLMDYQPLQEPISVQGFAIRTPQRRGFTVVEWGGVLGR